VYAASDDGQAITLRYVSEASLQTNKKPLHLLYLYPHQFQPPRRDGIGHFVYISDVAKLGKRFICGVCQMILSSAPILQRHLPICQGEIKRTKEKFVGNIMTQVTSMLEALF
jgi:hypothetical protein